MNMLQPARRSAVGAVRDERAAEQGGGRGGRADAAALGGRRAVRHRRRRPDRGPGRTRRRRLSGVQPQLSARLRRRRRLRRDPARPAERPRQPDQGRQDRDPARRHLELPPAGPLPHPRGRRGAARDLGDRLGLARGEQEGHQHEPHHAVLLQARRDVVLLRGDRRGARQLSRRPRELRRAHPDALQLPDAEALAPQRPRGLPVLQRRAGDGEDRRGDPADRASRLRLLLDLPLLARALRARPPHPRPDRHAALAALGGAGVGRARRRRACCGSRTWSTSATRRSRPRPR